MNSTIPKTIREKVERVTYEDTKELSRKIMARRSELGLTQMQVSKATGLSQQTVGKCENLNPLISVRIFDFFTLLDFYSIEANEVAQTLHLFHGGDRSSD